ncbi:MAG: hypothetical protein J0H24_17185 [Delftia acidovorans]|nr:hypothetical protein [Delftia acidovorans]
MSKTETQSVALRLADALEDGSYLLSQERNTTAAELRRLDARVTSLEFAFNEWHDKTDWVQETAQALELGMHRADVLRARIEALDAENKALRGLAATCYAGLGAECNLPENWLDALNAAANGQAFDTEGLLPFAATEARDETIRQLEAQVKGAALSERERICAAIKAEDDYCVTQGDYMLDSDDCIKVARGEWERPVYEVEAAAKTGDAA